MAPSNVLDPFDVRFGEILGKPIQPVRLDQAAFEEFKAHYEDNRAIDDEKRLEYYLSTQWLQFSRDDVFIDIAAQDCPFAFFVRKTFGCLAYRQDLYYLNPGIHGSDIGGDAANLPLPDGAITKIALHNSFEHFEGDSDTCFVHEAQRVLAHGGRMCIVPLFIAESYGEEKDAGWIDAQGVKHLWGVGARFARHYDLEQFKQRVLDHCAKFDVTVYRVEDATQVASGAYLQYFAVFQKR